MHVIKDNKNMALVVLFLCTKAESPIDDTTDRLVSGLDLRDFFLPSMLVYLLAMLAMRQDD